MKNFLLEYLIKELNVRRTSFIYRSFWHRLHLDGLLMLLLLVLLSMGFILLASATQNSTDVLIKQFFHIMVALVGLFVMAQIPPRVLRRWTPVLFIVSFVLLITVLLIGKMGKGAQRWISISGFRFQPSEIMRFTLPMFMAWLMSRYALPITFKPASLGLMLCVLVGIIIAKQPDLGTSLLVMFSGLAVLIMAGLSWQILLATAALLLISTPVLWSTVLHAYQKKRILILFNPEHDPLGSGYHIIQSKIAIGSGGLTGKGWLNGTQTNLNFLPEHATDFIFAVCAEEFGFIGCGLLLLTVLSVTARALYLATLSQDIYSQLLASSIALTFFMYAFVNVGMVTGILPVVGLPFPLVSYGGTALVTTLLSFGLLMSISMHRERRGQV